VVIPDPSDEAALRAFVGEDVADALAATPQDARWHAEGDVWTHTRMVLDALCALPAWQALDDDARAITFVAALAHDLGKPATTRLEPDGAISSRGHSARGEVLVRRWLWHLAMPFAAREEICAIVRHHQVPFFGITRDDAARTARRLSLRLRHDRLVLVTEAAGRGRRLADARAHAEMLDHTALWAEHCREIGCLDRAYPFADAHARVLHFESDRPADVAPYDDTTCEVIVMCGLPASGKDSWLEAHHPGLPVVSLDAIREATDTDPADDQGAVIHAARDAAREHLRAGRSFAWNATNLSANVRGRVIGLCRDYRARVHVVYCEVSPADLDARNRRRADPVPAAAYARMMDRWSIPALDEAHAVTYVIG
jgi:predicted kinase